MIEVSPDWWKDFFDEIYLITDARSVCDQDLTFREVDFLEKVLGLRKIDRILDLCGGHGRHSLELARRGYRNLTVLDYSQILLDLGKKRAQAQALRVKFHRADARFTGLKDKSYHVIIIMANSFGYFPQEEENCKILQEANRLLQPDGRLLLDLADREFLVKNLTPVSWHEATQDIVVCRVRELEADLVKAREMVFSEQRGLLRDGTYCERVYGEDRIRRLLQETGFGDIHVRRNFSLHQKKADYGFMSSRMIVTARRRRGSPLAARKKDD